MDNKAAEKENAIARKKSLASDKLPDAIISTDNKAPDAIIVGIAINIANLAESCRENPNSRAPDITAPAREVPGISARTCQKPIIRADL